MSLKTLIEKNAVLVNFIFNIDTKIKQEMLEDQKSILEWFLMEMYNILNV